MRYTSFYIKNYKGIKELTLDLDKKPTSDIYTLVGLNESGKTTILEAISTLSNEPSETEIHKLIPKSKKFNFNDTIEIHATLELDDDDAVSDDDDEDDNLDKPDLDPEDDEDGDTDVADEDDEDDED